MPDFSKAGRPKTYTREQVFGACEEILAEGEELTRNDVHKRLGGLGRAFSIREYFDEFIQLAAEREAAAARMPSEIEAEFSKFITEMTSKLTFLFTKKFVMIEKDAKRGIAELTEELRLAERQYNSDLTGFSAALGEAESKCESLTQENEQLHQENQQLREDCAAARASRKTMDDLIAELKDGFAKQSAEPAQGSAQQSSEPATATRRAGRRKAEARA